jgi:hypothetical protein
MKFLKLFSDVITFVITLLTSTVTGSIVYELFHKNVFALVVVILTGVIILFRFIKISKKVENTLKNRYSKSKDN